MLLFSGGSEMASKIYIEYGKKGEGRGAPFDYGKKLNIHTIFYVILANQAHRNVLNIFSNQILNVALLIILNPLFCTSLKINCTIH